MDHLDTCSFFPILLLCASLSARCLDIAAAAPHGRRPQVTGPARPCDAAWRGWPRTRS